MFGFGKRSPLSRYEARNPKCAAIFHPLVTNGFMTSGNTINPRFSEDCFEDQQIGRSLEVAFLLANKRKAEVGVDQHMIEVCDLHSKIIKETASRFDYERSTEHAGFEHAVTAIRMIAFGTTGGLATNDDHALAITADMLFALAMYFCEELEGSVVYHYGHTMKRFGVQFDAPSWSRCPPAKAQERMWAWEGSYPINRQGKFSSYAAA